MTARRPLVVVLGMHRSGTSALAGTLARLGLHAGSEGELLPAAADNPRGYFERHDVVDVNDRLLGARAAAALGERLREQGCGEADLTAGFGWLLGAFAPLRGADADMAPGVDACLDALHAGAGDARGVLLKDPRLSLTLPAWRARAAPRAVVMMVRSPAAVMDSLAHRDHVPAALGRFLWMRYTLGAVVASDGLPRLLLDYDRTLADPRSALAALGAFLAANGIEPDPARLAPAREFLAPELRHARHAEPPPDASGALYRELLAGAPGIATRPAAGLDETGAHDVELCQALCVILAHRLAEARHRGERLALALERVERHVVSGTVVRALRRLKRDPGFGAP